MPESHTYQYADPGAPRLAAFRTPQEVTAVTRMLACRDDCGLINTP
ncbi:MAG: hypothetical protein M1134_05680 [Actinobacteria bacterium]|nr:hypothetical protein [Actinomycetota bacterium]MCL5445104.1 hypothetical protein [Actinomycetota bacterium]